MVLVVGVNGTGKTTTVGRLARVLVADGKSVVLGAADTFRAAAADQLQTWGERVGVHTVRGPEGGDPASVGFESVQKGIDDGTDVVLVDTAGRLHTKAGLMDELGKVKRVVEKQAPVTEVLLVIDATTGQNGLAQARVFAEVVDVTGIVLTKLDGTAKGGIVVAVQRELGVPGEVRGPRRGRRRPRPVRRRGVRRRAPRLAVGRFYPSDRPADQVQDRQGADDHADQGTGAEPAVFPGGETGDEGAEAQDGRDRATTTRARRRCPVATTARTKPAIVRDAQDQGERCLARTWCRPDRCLRCLP